MNRTIKWTTDTDDVITSEDSTISVYLDGAASWIMEDHIDGDYELYITKEAAMNAGGKRLLLTQMGNFGVLIPAMDKQGGVVFTHQID